MRHRYFRFLVATAVGLVGGFLYTESTILYAQTPQFIVPLSRDNPAVKKAEGEEKVRNLRQLSTTKSLQIVRVDVSAVDSQELSVWLPDQGIRIVTRAAAIRGSKSEGTWSGSLTGPNQGTMTVIVRNGQVTGSINTPSAVYRIVSVGDEIAALVRLDVSKFPSDEPTRKNQ